MKGMTLVALSSLLLTTGCGVSEPDGRVAVSGKVTYQGKPLSVGQIVFTPAKGSPGLSAGGTVREGSFQIGADKGPTTGEYKVTVTVGLPSKDVSIGMAPADRSQPDPPGVQRFEFSRIINRDSENILELELPPNEADSSR